MSETLFLTSEDVAGLATPAEYVDAVREGYRQRGEGAAAEPRTALYNREPPGLFTSYAAVLPDTGAMGGYTYSAGFGAGDAWFVTPLFDADSGEPLALIDGASMNPFKTGAAGAVGVDALARPDAAAVGVFGAGPQARGQLRAVAAVRDVETVWVYSPTKSSREGFAGEMDRRLDGSVAAVSSPDAAVEGADVVITATDSPAPVFDGDLLEPGTHVTAMGQYHPEKRELDDATVARSTYVIDLRGRLDRDAGAYMHALEAGAIEADHCHAELGEVVAGVEPGRTDPDEITVFDSGGTGIETTAAAAMLYGKAREEGLGRTLSFAAASEALTGED